jgi:hypothetical protein
VTRSPGRKGIFPEIKPVLFCFHVRRCLPYQRPVREEGSGSVSAHLVAQVGAVDRRPTDPKFCDAESAGRLRTPLQTSTSTGSQRRGGASWTDYERRTHQVWTVERERAHRTVDAARTRGERGFGCGCSCGRRRMTSRALG